MKLATITKATNLLLLIGALWSASVTATPVEKGEHRDPSGSVIVTSVDYQSRPATEAQARYHSDAYQLAEQYPKDLGYPWIDQNGTLHERFVTNRGRTLSIHADEVLLQLQEQTNRSFEALERIKDDAVLMASAGIVDGDAIVSAEPDEKYNRVIVSVSRHSAALLATLHRLYGDAVAVRVDVSRGRARRVDRSQKAKSEPRLQMVGGQTRGDDALPYAGGARFIGTAMPGCTLGIPWTTGFVTAGHCVSGGVSPLAPNGATIGTTRNGYDENWNWGDLGGTVMWAGDSFFRGDIGLINAPYDSVDPQIFIGDEFSSLKRPVTAYWDIIPPVGSQYCVGGATNGEICGWKVISKRTNWAYSDGTIARNVNVGTKIINANDRRPSSGDSGGPVYTMQPDGTISIMGIHSGHADDGDQTHWEIFTDVSLITSGPFSGFPKFANLGAKLRIRNIATSKCLAIGSSSKNNGAGAIQYDCIIGSQGQTWFSVPHPSMYPWVWIKNGSGKCLAIGSSSTEDSAPAIQWDCLESSSGQRWLVNPDGSITNGSGKCLAIGNHNPDNNVKAIQWPCNGTDSQKWFWEMQN